MNYNLETGRIMALWFIKALFIKLEISDNLDLQTVYVILAKEKLG